MPPWANLGRDVIWNNCQGRKEFIGHAKNLRAMRIECPRVQAVGFLKKNKANADKQDLKLEARFLGIR